MDAGEIAGSIQGIADSMRAGFSEAAEEISQRFAQANVPIAGTYIDLKKFMKVLACADDKIMSSTADLIKEMLSYEPTK